MRRWKVAVMLAVALLVPSAAAHAPLKTHNTSQVLQPALPAEVELQQYLSGYRTLRPTLLRFAPGGEVLAEIPGQFVVGSSPHKHVSDAVMVSYRSQAGWVSRDDVEQVPAGTPLGATTLSYSKIDFHRSFKQSLARWCPDADIAVGEHAKFWATNQPMRIHVGMMWDPDAYSPALRTIALHECAHLLQYKAYRLDHPLGSVLYSRRLHEEMEQVNPAKDGQGVEHIADCMAELMGGARQGVDFAGRTFTVGYGQTCTQGMYEIARKLLKGKTLNALPL